MISLNTKLYVCKKEVLVGTFNNDCINLYVVSIWNTNNIQKDIKELTSLKMLYDIDLNF